MPFPKSVISGLLCFYLLLARVSLASRKRKGLTKDTNYPPLLKSSDLDPDELKDFLKHLKLFPSVLGAIVVDYLTTKRFYVRPFVIKRFSSRAHCSLVQTSILFADMSVDKKLCTCRCSLLDAKRIMMPSNMPDTRNLHAFVAYPEVDIFVHKGEVMLKRIGDSKVSGVMHKFANKTRPIQMAPKVINNFVYLFNAEELLLINLKDMKITTAQSMGYLHSVSLNDAGTLLAYATFPTNPKIMRIQCNTEGKANLVEHATVNCTGYSVMFLKNNILAVELGFGGRYIFYSVHEGRGQRIKPLAGEFVSEDLYNFSYSTTEDMVVAFVQWWKNPLYASVSIKSFFGDTQILILNPKNIKLNDGITEFAVSQDLTYLLRTHCSGPSFIYQLSEKKLTE
jgi:hypothetical protein